MKDFPARYGLLAVALLATTAPVLATSSLYDSTLVQHAQTVEANDRNRGCPRGERLEPGRSGADRSDRRFDRSRHAHPPAPIGLDVAARLSVLETYVGITADQQEAWRFYTSSVIALFDRPIPMEPQGGPMAEDEGGKPQQPNGVPGNVPLFSERLAQVMIERGEKAQALRDAIANLRDALDEEQLARLGADERAFAPPPMPSGPVRPPKMGTGPDHRFSPDTGRTAPPPVPAHR
ncbi:MAG: hypothetical protein ACT6RL_19910 [Neoaquamicrobium sediminum]|uniref:hypothetical protein n=1 Tax=Neoaquamicrobium sediminum TaxID=1849104 RepID=UPI0040354CA0